MATYSDKSGLCKINRSESGSETDLSDQTNIKQVSTLPGLIDTNNNKDLASHDNRIVTKDKLCEVHVANDIDQSKMNVTNFQPDQIFSRMEASFALALDKICQQQSDLFYSKFQLMEHYYNQSIETNNNNFKMLQDTITTILKPTSENDKLAAPNIKGIDPNKLSSEYSAEKPEAFTLEQTDHVIQELQMTPDILVLHSLSNVVQTASNENSIESLGTNIDHAREKFEDAKIVISLPTPRADE
ncbi:unnamed protein product [Mytilus coruscus]|uniref:Uncharacterized protein n=1 Tax=Mytilus coruscus TaxID=42192 RepID=A0A6J8AU72_MYTCO|nr:unnamed protein product [Mytilus coruscus]